MAADDPVDDRAMIFTEADVYVIAGYLSKTWGVPYEDDLTDDIEEAIQETLNMERPWLST